MFRTEKRSQPTSVPLEPTIVTPPRHGTRSFIFLGALETDIGYTPQRHHTVQLKRHEGLSHQWVSTVTTPDRLLRGDSILDSPDRRDFKRLSLHLFVQLKDLKVRTDQDYKHRSKSDDIDSGHYIASITNIKRCISSLKECFRLAPNAVEFLDEINQAIETQKVYNPFGLKQIYGNSELDYSLELANNEDIYLSRITEKQCRAIKIKKLCFSEADDSPKRKQRMEYKAPIRGLFDDLPPPKADHTMKHDVDVVVDESVQVSCISV